MKRTTLDGYQAATDKTATYPECPVYRQITASQVYCGLRLASESGAVAGKLADLFTDGDGFVNDHDRQDLAKHLGDVLRQTARLAVHIGYSLEEIAALNLAG